MRSIPALLLLGCQAPPRAAEALPCAAAWGELGGDPGLAGRVLVADTGAGQVLLIDRESRAVLGGVCLAEMLPEECAGAREDGSALCQVFGLTQDIASLEDAAEGKAGLLVSYAGEDEPSTGVLRIDLAAPTVLDWRIDGLSFPEGDPLHGTCAEERHGEPLCRLRMPHAAQWTPDGALAIADTLNDRVLLVRPPESGAGVGEVVASITAETPGWGEARYPNNVQHITQGERELLLVSYKGSDPDVSGNELAGRIMLWDITDRGAPALEWAYPQRGYLAAVHNAHIQSHPEGPLLLYGHSFGASAGFADLGLGSVGAAWAAIGRQPRYIADFITATDEPLGFVRDADLIEAGRQLLVTDSGCESPSADCDHAPRVLELHLELPAAPGLSGAFSDDHAQQSFVVLPMIGHSYDTTLSYPFEADLLAARQVPEEEPSGEPGLAWDTGLPPIGAGPLPW